MIIENTGLNGMSSDLAHLDESSEKLGFVRDGEAMFFSNPCQREMPHISTVLTRARFAAATAAA